MDNAARHPVGDASLGLGNIVDILRGTRPDKSQKRMVESFPADMVGDDLGSVSAFLLFSETASGGHMTQMAGVISNFPTKMIAACLF
jgi:hypothetical protein